MYSSVREKSILVLLLTCLLIVSVNLYSWELFPSTNNSSLNLKQKELSNLEPYKQKFGKLKQYEIADDYVFVDDIHLNGREFDSLNERVIEFYRDDLIDGKVIIDGILESEDESVPLSSLFVEITTDGGQSWSRAKGHDEWEWSFEPEIGVEYEFSLRVIRLLDQNDEEDANQLAQEETMGMEAKAYLVYHIKQDQNETISDNRVIDVGSADSVKLEGYIANHTGDSRAVHVDITVKGQSLLSKDMIVPKSQRVAFSVDVLDTIEEGDNHASIVISEAAQASSVEEEALLSSNFTISKTDKIHYKIGDFTLITDAVASNGKISGEGKITVDVMSKFDNFDGVFNVDFQNLSVDSSKKITSGTITYSNQLTYKPISKVEIIANTVVFTPNDTYIKGELSLKKIGKFIAPVNIDIPHMPLQYNNFKLDTDYVWDGDGQKVPLYDGSFALSLMLKKLHLKIDSTKSLLKIVQITDLEGGIKFGDTFDSTNTTIKLNTDGSIAWTLQGDASIENSEYFYFNSCSGTIDLLGDDPSVSIAGNLKVYFEKSDNPERKHIEIALEDGLTIDSRGLQGDVGFDIETIEQGKPTVFADIPMKVKSFHILFDGYVSGGGITLALTYDDFFKSGKEFKALIAADVSADGFSNFRIEGNSATLAIENFATFSFENFALEMSGAKPQFSTDINVHLPQSVILGDDIDLKLEHVLLSANGVKLDGGSVWKGIGEGNSPSASFYGVGLDLEKVGVGIHEGKLFIGFEGGGSIGGEIVSVSNMQIAFYKSLDVELLNTPSVDIQNSAISFHASLKKEDNEEIKGFTARGSLKFLTMGDGLQVNAEFMSGSFKNSHKSYWRVAASASTATAIPLAPIPLNIYGFGGGVAYNVMFEPRTRKWTPKENSGITISLTTIFGTTDGGYTLNGPATLSFSSGGAITFNTNMYLRAGLGNVVEDRKIEVAVQLIPSPFRLYATGSANITEKASETFNLLSVNGNVDMIFSSSNSHLYIGTKEDPVIANFLEVANSDGYLMLDDKGLAFGYKLSFSKTASCCAMYGSIDLGTSLDMMIGIRPLYIDAEGKIWAIVSAGVKYKKFEYEVFSGGATIAARFRAPNPSWGKFDVSLYYSILSGTVSGKYSMTYWINKPEGGSDAIETTAENLDLIQYIIPFEGESSVSRMPRIEIATTLPIGKKILIDDLIDEPTGEEYKLFIRKANEIGSRSQNFHPATQARDFIGLHDINATYNYADSLNGGVVGTNGNKILLHVNKILPTNHNFRLVVEAYLQEQSSGEVISEDIRFIHFKTSNDPEMNFRSIVDSVHPAPNAKNVYKQSDVYVKVRGVYDLGIELNLYDPLNRRVNTGPWRFRHITEDSSAASQMYAYIYEHHPDLDMIVVYECDQTQEIREAVYSSDGKEQNPFTYNAAIYENTHGASNKTYRSGGSLNYNVYNVPTDAVQTQKKVATKKVYNARGEMQTTHAPISYESTQSGSGQDTDRTVYTYTRKELREYTIKAQKRENGSLVDLYSSTFEVYGSARREFRDKAGNIHTEVVSYDNDIDMLHKTMMYPRFVIHRLPIDYEAKQREWDEFMENSYMLEYNECDALLDTLADDTADEEDPQITACFDHLYKRAESFKKSLDKKYAHGQLESLTLEFEHSGMMDPSNVAMSITPQCRITNDDGDTFEINPDAHAFSNLNALGQYGGNDEYTILSNSTSKTVVMLNLDKVDGLSQRISQAIVNIADINSKNITCGYFTIAPRYLTSDTGDASVDVHGRTQAGHLDVYRNNVPLREE
jgi:hypothetical protein